MTETTHSEQQAKAQYESIREMVRALSRETAAEDYAENLTREQCQALLNEVSIEVYDKETLEELREAVAVNIGDETLSPEDFEFDEDEARERIQEDALGVAVRSGWYTPGDSEGAKPAEYEILLCTGGPACRIIGELSEHMEPESARIQHQDWGTPWIEYFDVDRETLLTYARCFYFGE